MYNKRVKTHILHKSDSMLFWFFLIYLHNNSITNIDFIILVFTVNYFFYILSELPHKSTSFLMKFIRVHVCIACQAVETVLFYTFQYIFYVILSHNIDISLCERQNAYKYIECTESHWIFYDDFVLDPILTGEQNTF